MFTGPYFVYLWAHFQYTFTSFSISLSSPLPSLSPSHHISLRCENKFFGRWLWCSVHCVRGVCSCLCMFAAGKLWLFSVCEVYPYCFLNIYCYMWGFLKYLFWFPVYIYVRCVLVFLRNSMWDFFFFLWTSTALWGLP